MFIALFAVAFAVNVVSATFVTIDRVEVNDQIVFDNVYGYSNPGLTISETVPVEVYFTANEDASKVKVKVSLEKGGLRDDVEESTERFAIFDGNSYVKKFSLKLPSSMDIEDLTKELDLVIKFTAEDKDSVEESFALDLQRDEFNLNVLSVDIPQVVTAGSTVAVDVVVENNGLDRLENVYARVSMPDLGIQNRIYLGDIDPLDESETDDNDKDLDRQDTTYRRVYLTLPRNTAPGVYSLVVEAYNVDTTTTANGKVVISEVDAGVYSPTTAKTIAPGQETTYSISLVNPSNSIAIYTVTPDESEGLVVSVDQSVVTVPAGGSATVTVRVKATSSVSEGTHLVTVRVVNSETSELVKQVTFTANVEKSTGLGGTTRTDTVFVLTVVLVIIFVVLLIILIVLLTRRPAETEEFGETSYY